MPSDLSKLVFIRESLEWYGVNVDKAIKAAARRMQVQDTEDLINSVRHKVLSHASQAEGRFELFFAEYGRMVDMGVGRGNKVTSRADRRKRVRKPRPFYSRTAYGMLDRLIYRLSNYYTAEVAARIKQKLQ